MIDVIWPNKIPLQPWKNVDHCAVSLTIRNFGSLLILAVTSGAFLLVAWVATKGLFFFLQESPIP